MTHVIRELASGIRRRVVALIRRPIGRLAGNARLAADIQAMRAELAADIQALRAELHAFAGSLHAGTIARIDALDARVESDLMELLKLRRTPDSAVESELTDSMRMVIENATAQIKQALLDRGDLNARILEQEFVRVTSRLERRLDEISSGRARVMEASEGPSLLPLTPGR
jgi:hypothetical protein